MPAIMTFLKLEINDEHLVITDETVPFNARVRATRKPTADTVLCPFSVYYMHRGMLSLF